MKALILAAGYATRLYPLTENMPKPLLKVAGRPIINYIIDKLEEIDSLDKIFIVTNDKFFSHFKNWLKDFRFNKKTSKGRLRIRIVNDDTKSEDSRIGAIGDISLVIEKEKIRDDLLIIGGDNLFTRGLKDFIKKAQGNKPALTIGLFDVHNSQAASRYGVVEMDKKKCIISFSEKPALAKSTLVAMCLYYYPQEKLGLTAEYLKGARGQGKKDATGNYIDWLYKKERVYSFVFRGHWYDIGHIDAYKRADEIFTRLLRIKNV